MPEPSSPYGSSVQRALTAYHKSLPGPVATLEVCHAPVPAACRGRRERAIVRLAALRTVHSPHPFVIRDVAVSGNLLTVRAEQPRHRPLAELLPQRGLPSATSAVRIALQVLSWQLAVGCAHALGALLGEPVPLPLVVSTNGLTVESRSGMDDFVRIDVVGLHDSGRCDCDECIDLMLPVSSDTAYLPAEVLRGGEMGESARVFASALLLYELLTSTRPGWDASAPIKSVMDRVNTPITAPSEALGVRLPMAIESWLMRGLAPDPGDRPADLVAWTTGLLRAARQEQLPVDLALDLSS